PRLAGRTGAAGLLPSEGSVLRSLHALHLAYPDPQYDPLMAAVQVISDSELDPGSRALLDLTLRHGMSDEELAQMLGEPTDLIAERRERAIGEVTERAAEIETLRRFDRVPTAEEEVEVIEVAERMLHEAAAARAENRA